MTVNLAQKKKNRAQIVGKARGFTTPNKPNNKQGSRPNSSGKKIIKKGVASAAKKGKGPKGKGPNGKGKKGNGPKKESSAMDLDKEMDTYWFKGGKGPNPDLVSLDKEMDDYNASKKTSV